MRKINETDRQQLQYKYLASEVGRYPPPVINFVLDALLSLAVPGLHERLIQKRKLLWFEHDKFGPETPFLGMMRSRTAQKRVVDDSQVRP